jgi:hypothetical protein
LLNVPMTIAALLAAEELFSRRVFKQRDLSNPIGLMREAV